MTHANLLSRRGLFSLTTGGASALALSRLCGVAHAKPLLKPVGAPRVPEGLEVVAGDLTLDPELRVVAEKLVARARHGFVQAVARPEQAPKGDKIAAASQKLLGSLKAPQQARLQLGAKQLAGADAATRVKLFGEFEKVGSGPAARKLIAPDLKRALAHVEVKAAARPKLVVGPSFERLEFHLNSVKCLEETDEVGADEILLGGQIVEPSGNLKKIDRFKVSDDFDKGEIRYYDYSLCGSIPRKDLPPYLAAMCPNGDTSDRYAGRKLGSAVPAAQGPSTFALVLVMGEEDTGGGFVDMLGAVYDALKDEIEKELQDLGAKAGEAIGGALGEAAGQILAWAVSEIIEWISSLFDNKDDLVQARSWLVELQSKRMSHVEGLAADHLPSPAGTWASPMKKLKFRGDGGAYDARLHWRART